MQYWENTYIVKQTETEQDGIKIKAAESCHIFSLCPLDCFRSHPGVSVPPEREQRHQRCVCLFLWIFECCPWVKFNNHHAVNLDFILSILIELGVSPINLVLVECPWGKLQQEMALECLLFIRGLWWRMWFYLLNHCPVPKICLKFQCQEIPGVFRPLICSQDRSLPAVLVLVAQNLMFQPLLHFWKLCDNHALSTSTLSG